MKAPRFQRDTKLFKVSKKKLLILFVIFLFVIAVVLFIFLRPQKSDAQAREYVNQAIKLLNEDKKKNSGEALSLLDKSVNAAKSRDLYEEKKAAMCMQYELYDCAISSYKKLAIGEKRLFYTKLLGDAYRYNKQNEAAITEYEKVKSQCGNNNCEGVSTNEMEYFITQLKENKPIVETR